MPWSDWQFWVVTLLAAGGAWIVVRPFVPRRKGRGGAHCASGAAARRPKRVRLRINVDRDPSASPDD